jgi:hypothetical protein
VQEEDNIAVGWWSLWLVEMMEQGWGLPSALGWCIYYLNFFLFVIDYFIF